MKTIEKEIQMTFTVDENGYIFKGVELSSDERLIVDLVDGRKLVIFDVGMKDWEKFRNRPTNETLYMITTNHYCEFKE